ncbi:unnamed protein product [Clonostachys rosea f. rosea IK726]|uniref:Uncharacterized protein n=1 Tax=Clonostachys rosea f. rosea IK726 TaxID=1349383 RepID=A0ACA9U4J8_BIOOC|nr:unnamed protein product [Clonostachys rosea f. rosea IK726]
MQVKYIAATLGLLCFSVPSVALPQTNVRESSPETLFNGMQKTYETNINKVLSSNASDTSCTRHSVSVRRSWDVLSRSERLEYIHAVKCLHNLPSKVDKTLAPSARVRADDFTYQHMNQTNFAHASGIFLPWHRQFMWMYEKSLREECGYKGYVPYWDWMKYSDDQSKASIFEDGPAGFGGNGKAISHPDTNQSLPDVPGPFYITRKAGTGGGCVTTGAFANLSVNLGPVVPGNNSVDDPYGVKNPPHCLSRDFNQEYSDTGLTYTAALTLLQSADYNAFFGNFDHLVHGFAHQYLGGDGYDFYSSPSDPVFFLLHSQIDRLWTIWQGLDQDVRKSQVGGTETFANRPPSANTTLDTILRMTEILGGDVNFGHTISTIENDYCYIYA